MDVDTTQRQLLTAVKMLSKHSIMGTNPVVRGPISEAVAANVQAVRKGRGMSQQQLAGALAAIGRPTLATTIAKIEAGDRRVDVDDLVALGLVLNVSPARLLIGDGDQDGEVSLTSEVSVPSWRGWQWATGEHSLFIDDDDVSNPEHARHELAWAAERPLWVRRRQDNDLHRAASRLMARVEQAVGRLAERRSGRPSAMVTKVVVGQVRGAVDAVVRELDLMAEEATDGKH